MITRKHLETVCIPIAALGIALILFGLFCAAIGSNPFAVYSSIYKAAFSRWSRWQETLVRASPLMLSALCTLLPARLGLVIIGNEGALVLGGLASVLVGLSLGTSLPPLLVQTAMFFAGIGMGGVWIALVGWLRHYRGVNETISSLLLNYIAIAIFNHLVEGPLRDPTSLNKPSTMAIAPINQLGTLPGTNIHYGLLYGLIACLLAYFLLNYTTIGFATRIIGGNIRAAQIVGLPVGKLTLMICFLGGACAGLAGMVEVAAVHGRANSSLNVGYGYGGILVAFVARHHPLVAVLIAILVGGVVASGGVLQRSHHLPDATVLVFQGIIFLVVLFSESLYGKLPIFQLKSEK